MAMFPTHIKTSTLLGIGYGTVAFVGYEVPATTCLVGAGLCSIGGILPDIDSGPGIPLREITTFLASVVPTMLITRMLSYNMNQEMLILVGAIIYAAIRFGLAHFLRHYTIHRGMFHSFPTMAIFAELTYLLFYGESSFVRIFMVTAVCLGVFCHLLLDEIYSVEWDGTPRLKSSFGTAMKFVGRGWWPNVTCYGKLIVLSFIVMNDPSVVHRLYTGQTDLMAKNVGQSAKDRLASAMQPSGLGQVASSRPVMPANTSYANTSPAYLPPRPANAPPAATYPSPASYNAQVPIDTSAASNRQGSPSNWPTPRQTTASAQIYAPTQPAAANSQPTPTVAMPTAYAPQATIPQAIMSPTRDDRRAPAAATPQPSAGQRFW